MMRSALVVAVLVMGPWVARGDCLARPMHVIEVEIRSCETVEAYAARHPEAGVEWEWQPQSRTWMMKRSAGGIVIEGIVGWKWLVTAWNGKAAKADPPVWANEPGTWFVQPEAKLSCETVTAGQRVTLVHAHRCCCVQPPPQFGCWYEMDELAPVHDIIAKAIGLR